MLCSDKGSVHGSTKDLLCQGWRNFQATKLRVSGTKTPRTQTLPSQRKPQIYTHRSVGKPLLLLWKIHPTKTMNKYSRENIWRGSSLKRTHLTTRQNSLQIRPQYPSIISQQLQQKRDAAPHSRLGKRGTWHTAVDKTRHTTVDRTWLSTTYKGTHHTTEQQQDYSTKQAAPHYRTTTRKAPQSRPPTLQDSNRSIQGLRPWAQSISTLITREWVCNRCRRGGFK